MRAKLIELTAGQVDRLARSPGAWNSAFDDRLAVVEGRRRPPGSATLSSRRRGHEPALHLGDPAVGKQHHQPHVGAAAQGLHRRAAGVARGGADDGQRARPGRQRVLVEPRQELHGHVLERQGRPVEQLQQPEAGRQLPQRRDGGVGEAGVGVARTSRRGRRGRWRRRRSGRGCRRRPRRRAGRRRRRSRPASAAARLRAHRGRRRAPGRPAPRRGSRPAARRRGWRCSAC